MGKVLGAIDNFMAEFEKAALGFGIILLSLVVIIGIVGRFLFQWAWIGTEEFSKFCVIWITFMGTSLAARGDRHISMAAFVDMTPERIRNAFYVVIGFLSALFCFAITYLGLTFAILSMKGGQVTPALMLPVWPFYIALPIGMFLTGVQYIRLSLQRMNPKGTQEQPVVKEDLKID